MHPNMVKLANCRNAREAIQSGLIHCGFEFEFHNFKELKSEEAPESRPELPYYKQIIQAMSHFCLNGGTINETDVTFQGQTFSPRAVIDHIIATVPDVRYERQRTNGPSGGFEAVKASSLGPRLAPAKMELGQDGSVRGGEIRTLGACLPAEFMRAAKEIFRKEYKWEVDEGCSFHIHLSVPEVVHSHGYQTQYRLIEGVALNASRIPAAVVKRWKRPSSYHFYRVQLSREKYSFVHFHGQGTWEFRCWGNISSYRDALQCLLLSIEAMIHAAYCRLYSVPRTEMKKAEVPDFVAENSGEDDGGEESDQLTDLWAALVGIGGPVTPVKGVG